MVGINWFDIGLIVLLFLGVWIGFMQGLVRQILALAALYVSIVLAAQYFHAAASILGGLFRSTPEIVLNLGGFFIVLLGIVAVVNLLTIDAYKLTKLRMMPVLDHFGGMILGFINTWVLLTIAINVLAFALSAPTWGTMETARILLKSGLTASALTVATDATLPTIFNAIKPWLPAGLPAIFNL